MEVDEPESPVGYRRLTAEEIEAAREQLRAGIEAAREAAKERGCTVDPRIAAARAEARLSNLINQGAAMPPRNPLRQHCTHAVTSLGTNDSHMDPSDPLGALLTKPYSEMFEEHLRRDPEFAAALVAEMRAELAERQAALTALEKWAQPEEDTDTDWKRGYEAARRHVTEVLKSHLR